MSNGTKPATPGQQAPQPTKTDQQILEELRQAGGGERRRSVGLTSFVVLLAIVVVVFIAVNNRKDQQANQANQNTVSQTTTNSNGTTDSNAQNTTDQNQTTSNSTTSNDQSAAAGEATGELPNAQSTKTEESYSEAAQVGEGVTHLARRALHAFFADHNISDLTRAHKIFAEDYVTKHSTPTFLGIGEGRTFSHALLDEAVTNARALTPAQLANLQQFANQVPGL